MSNEIPIEHALKRQKIFKNLKKHLQTLKETLRKLDPQAFSKYHQKLLFPT